MRALFTLLLLALAPALRAESGNGVAVRDTAAADSATPFTRNAFLAALGHDLSAHFNLEGELQLELVRPWSAPARLAAVWSLQVLEYPSVATSSMLVRVRLVADGAPVAAATRDGEAVVLRASLWRDVWTARQPLVVGTTFDPSALETRRVDLFREREVLPAAVGDRSFIFARAVPAGRSLTWRDISRRPLVKKGDLIEVTASSGALLVTMKALAMENGAQGDTVTVRNPVSQKNFAAVVVDENRAQVRF